MIEIKKHGDGQLAAYIDGVRVAFFQNDTSTPLNFVRGVTAHGAMLVAAAVVEWLTGNPPENLPPPVPPVKQGHWKWIDTSPELDLAPLLDESTAQATETSEAMEVENDG